MLRSTVLLTTSWVSQAELNPCFPRQVPSMESLEVLGKVIRNVAVNPSENKYRKLRLSNAKVHEAVIDTPGALSALQAMGWQQDAAEPDSLVFPGGRQLTMAQVSPADRLS